MRTSIETGGGLVVGVVWVAPGYLYLLRLQRGSFKSAMLTVSLCLYRARPAKILYTNVPV
jgi:hypothetical protein